MQSVGSSFGGPAPWTQALGWVAAGCAACCLGPVIALTGIGATTSVLVAKSIGSAIIVSAVGLLVLTWWKRARMFNRPKRDDRSSPAKCRLPVSDRAQRTADFQRLFAAAFLDRTREPNTVQWRLRATDWSETESRRLAALETHCCDGIRFDIARTNDSVIWRISGPPSARETLDALNELPVLVGTDEGASRLWDALDAAACRSGRNS